MTHRVWVGAAGSATGWGVIQSIRERWPDVVIIAADSNPREQVAAVADADVFVPVPVAADPAFAALLPLLLAEHRVDAYVPIHDLELIAAARLRDAGALPDGVACSAPSLAAAELCWDKLATGRVLEAAGVPHPRTAPGPDAWPGPGIAKPRAGVGSRGVRVFADGDERSDEERSDRYVAQERCAAPEVTIDVFRGRDARWASVCRERLATRGGVATAGRMHADTELHALAGRVADAVGLTGAFCFQVMRGADGGWRVTDVNPRVGGATRMSVAVGVDIHAALLADLWGDDPWPYLPPLDGERFVARGFVERVVTP